MNKSNIAYARSVLSSEAETLMQVAQRIGEGFEQSVQAVINCQGRIIVTGIGKAGTVGEKITATLCSTGTPAYSLHPAEAVHGNLGAILREDIVLIFSNSGESDEITRLLPIIRKIGAGIISVTGRGDSALARNSDAVIDIGRIDEVCPLGLAPTNSTTAMLAVGDALALCVSNERNFDMERYALYHPGGEIGRKLMKVSECMKTGKQLPKTLPQTAVKDVLLLITRSRTGAACVTDSQNRLLGIFTDGDLRRYLNTYTDLCVPVGDIMTASPKTALESELCIHALDVMKEHQIDELPVVDSHQTNILTGILDVQDLLKAGILK